MNPLITVAHGTRHRGGAVVASSLTARAGRRLGVAASATFLELNRPRFAQVMGQRFEARPVVVPLLLAGGVHLDGDIPEAVQEGGSGAIIAPALGPHPLLAEVLLRRLLGSGARPGEPVVLAAAGSSRPAGLVDLKTAGRLLQARWPGPVRVATMSGLGPSLAAQIEASKPAGRVTVAPYLLAPGFFAERITQLATYSGADLVTEVLGAEQLIAELIVRRYRWALSTPTLAATG
ncbi:sirohydrochlorin chelatase [Nocardioides sp. Bht2]|uniref:sirohydrochlorin chelatase n=1 Tax=Nocardioides sp. Bht2 TaxID=3392297 RepID=UPI0039B66D76